MSMWTMWMSRWSWLALVPALALGCGKKEEPGPPCGKVADHVTEVVAKAYPGHADMMPTGARKQWVATCESKKFSAKQRRCMMDAQTPDALAACIREKADEKKPEAPGGSPPLPTVPAAPAPGATPPAAPAATPPAAPAPAPAAPAGSAPAPAAGSATPAAPAPTAK